MAVPNSTLLLLLLLVLLLLLLFSAPFTTPAKSKDCVYTAYVRTGSIWKGGTDSTIGLTLYDWYGKKVEIRNLVAWGGLMEPWHNYFERGNLDIFSGRGPCLTAPVCAMNLTSDGSGPHHGWYCNYVEVTSTGPHLLCAQKLFTVEQWLALDAPPYKLNAFRNYCPEVDAARKLNAFRNYCPEVDAARKGSPSGDSPTSTSGSSAG